MKNITLALIQFLLIALSTGLPLSEPVRKLDKNTRGLMYTKPDHHPMETDLPRMFGNSFFYDVFIPNPFQFQASNPEYYYEPSKMTGISSNRHRRQTTTTNRDEKTKKGRKIDDLMVSARKLIDPEILSGIDLSDDEQLAQLENLIAKEQAKRARYSFAYAVSDELSDSYSERTEERDSGIVRGSYSWADGFTRNKVTYEADEKGYRVTGYESEPIGGGPSPNPLGVAMVHQLVSGVSTKYAIRGVEVENDGDEGDVSGGEDDVQSRGGSDIKLVDVTPDFVAESVKAYEEEYDEQQSERNGEDDVDDVDDSDENEE